MKRKPVVVANLFGLMSASAAIAAEDPTGVTFTKDVLPILQRECQGCHRPGQIAGPRMDPPLAFSLPPFMMP